MNIFNEVVVYFFSCTLVDACLNKQQAKIKQALILFDHKQSGILILIFFSCARYLRSEILGFDCNVLQYAIYYAVLRKVALYVS